jgi:hypothetical protein
MNDDDWKHVERMLNIIELCAGHGTTYNGIATAAHAELRAIKDNLAAPKTATPSEAEEE